MKLIQKIFILIILLLIGINGVNASLINGNIAYWSLDNLSDSSGNGYTLTNNGATSTTGKLGNSYYFDGNNRYLKQHISTGNVFSFGCWFKVNQLNKNQMIYTFGNNNAVEYAIYVNSNNKIELIHSNPNSPIIDTTYTVNTNQWYYITGIVSNGNYIKLYVNGQYIGQTTDSTADTDFSYIYFGINPYNGGDSPLLGSIDEASLWNRALTSTEISQLYNNGNGYNPYTSISNQQINITNISLINNSYFNTNNLSINISLENISTNSNINSSYSLDNSNYIQFSTNQLNSTLNLNNLTEGNHTLQFYFENNETNTTSSIYKFIIDTQAPIINNNIKQEYNDYTIQLNSSCVDSNLDYCNISIENNTYQLNVSNITLQHNGNISYIIQAGDKAGNQIQLNGTIFINPYVYFYFKYTNGTYVNNFSFNNKNFQKYAKFKIYNDSIKFGNNTFLFEKLGIKSANITFSINNTSRLNLTSIVSLAKLIISIYNQENNQLIKNTNFSLNFIGEYGFTDSIINGQKNISKIFFNNQDYQLIVSSNNYKSESKFFKFSNKNDLNLNLYVINKTTAGYVYVKVVDPFGEIKKNVLVQTLQWDSIKSSYVLVGETKTDDNGFTTNNIVLDSKLYKFRAIDNGIIVESTSQIITTADNGKIIVLTLNPSTTKTNLFLDDIIYNFSKSFNNQTNITTVKFSWVNTKGNDINGCINVYEFYNNQNEKLLSSNCSIISSSATIINNFKINTSKNIKISAVIKDSNNHFIILKSIIFYSKYQLNKFIDELGISYLILPLLFIISIIIGLYTNVTFGAIGVIISSGVGLYLVPQFINRSIIAFIMFIGIAIIIGGNKRK